MVLCKMQSISTQKISILSYLNLAKLLWQTARDFRQVVELI